MEGRKSRTLKATGEREERFSLCAGTETGDARLVGLSHAVTRRMLMEREVGQYWAAPPSKEIGRQKEGAGRVKEGSHVTIIDGD